MRCKIAVSILLLAVAVRATGQTVSGLPVSAYVDTEAETNVVFSTGNAEVRTFNLSLDLTASVSNNVAVAFGRDVDGSGTLDRCETDAVIGWDSGAWFWRDRRSGEEARIARADGDRKLEALLTLNPRKQAKALVARDRDGVVFSGRVPATLFDPDWDLMCVTVRGAGASNGIIVSQTSVYGFGVVVR